MKRWCLALAFLLSVMNLPAVADTLDNIAAAKLLHVGFIDGEAPFASKGPDGKPVGYAIDLCRRVAETLRTRIPDLQVIYVETNLTDAFHDIVTGKIDLLCGAITASLNRRELVDFSQTFFVSGMSALLRRDSPTDIRDLLIEDPQVSPPRSPIMRAFANHVFGVRAGTTTEATLRQALTLMGATATILPYDSHEVGVAALQAHQIDAYFADRGLLIGLLARVKGADQLVAATRWFTHEPYAIALPRGDSNFRLLIDHSLTAFYRSPDFKPMLEQYFGSAAPAVNSAILLQSLPE